jgi:hypothetical protein
MTDDWERRHALRREQESAEMEAQALERYDLDLKKANAFAIIKTEDPLEHASPVMRDFHITWATRLRVMAGDACVAALADAELHRAGL